LLSDQWNVTQQPAIQNRVKAASYNAAVNSIGQPAPSPPITQAERDKLTQTLLVDPGYALVTFIGYVASDPALTKIDDITDTQINGRLTQAIYDQVAHQLFKGAT